MVKNCDNCRWENTVHRECLQCTMQSHTVRTRWIEKNCYECKYSDGDDCRLRSSRKSLCDGQVRFEFDEAKSIEWRDQDEVKRLEAKSW